MVAESSPQQEHMVCALQERIGEVARGLGRRFGGLRACYTTLCPMFRARVTSILQMLPANQRKSSSSSKKTGALVAASTLTEGLARLRAKAEAMASRYAAVVHPGRPPYTLRRPKNLRRMVGKLFSLVTGLFSKGSECTGNFTGSDGRRELDYSIIIRYYRVGSYGRPSM